MDKVATKQKGLSEVVIITSGSHYLDIDAYACCIALKELFELKGREAIAYSFGVYNYSICKSLIEEEKLINRFPEECPKETAEYIIVDVSDPDYLEKSIPLDNVIEIYDHHSGFEEYWKSRIGEKAHIEFIGAAATLIYREWKKDNLQDKMSVSTAKLLLAAILDNTLNLTSSNTTNEDRNAFDELCKIAGVNEEWSDLYFSEVQKNIEKDLKNALFNDIKRIQKNDVLPPRIAQLCIWNAAEILKKLPTIREWLNDSTDSWMINIIDLKHSCSYFVCDAVDYQNNIENIFDVRFESGVAKTNTPYLRKEIIKKSNIYKNN